MFLDLWSKSYSFCFEIIGTEGLEWHAVPSVIIIYVQGYSIIPCNRATDFVIRLNLNANWVKSFHFAFIVWLWWRILKYIMDS